MKIIDGKEFFNMRQKLKSHVEKTNLNFSPVFLYLLIVTFLFIVPSHQSTYSSLYHPVSFFAASLRQKMSASNQPLFLTADEAAVLHLLQQLYPAANHKDLLFCVICWEIEIPSLKMSCVL